jgi:hypothetical protein
MFKFVANCVLGCCGMLCCADCTQACNGGCSCPCSPVAMSAPKPAVQDMPGMPMPPAPQASAGSQYRTYSYQPAPTYYRSYGRTQASKWSDAGRKIRGDY